MSRTFTVAVFAGVLLLGAFGIAQASPRMRVEVPFEFHAGDRVLPAGEYVVEFRGAGASSAASAIYILNRDKEILHVLHAIPGTRNLTSQDYVVFNRYGKDYFLVKACQGSLEAQPPKTRLERELEIAHGRPQDKGLKVAAK